MGPLPGWIEVHGWASSDLDLPAVPLMLQCCFIALVEDVAEQRVSGGIKVQRRWTRILIQPGQEVRVSESPDDVRALIRDADTASPCKYHEWCSKYA